MSFLMRVKTKSPHVRKRYAVLIAAVITASIALVWVTTLPHRFSGSMPELSDVSISTDIDNLIFEAKEQVAQTITGLSTSTQKTDNLDALRDSLMEHSGDPIAVEGVATYDERALPATEHASEVAPPKESDVFVERTPTPTVILIGTTTVLNPE